MKNLIKKIGPWYIVPLDLIVIWAVITGTPGTMSNNALLFVIYLFGSIMFIGTFLESFSKGVAEKMGSYSKNFLIWHWVTDMALILALASVGHFVIAGLMAWTSIAGHGELSSLESKRDKEAFDEGLAEASSSMTDALSKGDRNIH